MSTPRQSRFASRLTAFVARWYAVPIDRLRDGEPVSEITATEDALGRLPAVLRDWYALVGRRIRSVQDRPVALAQARTGPRARALRVYVENQGNWTVAAPLDSRADDPRAVLTPSASSVKSGWKELIEWSPPKLSVFLLAAVTRETLLAAADAKPGPLGPLRDGVIGSYEWGYRGAPPLPLSKLPPLPSAGPWWATRDVVMEEVNGFDARHPFSHRCDLPRSRPRGTASEAHEACATRDRARPRLVARPRVGAPELLLDEIDAALALLEQTPHIGAPYRGARIGTRRLLLTQTRYHVYYCVRGEELVVLSIWSAVRGRGPRL